jgi:hypothetical protein
MKWSENTELFKKELTDGFQWQELPATFFKLHGFSIEMPPMAFRENISDANKFFETKDLIVNSKRIEIKSRKERFTSPNTFPYDTIIIDTVKKFTGRSEIPFAYIMISRITGSMLWIDTSNRDKWKVERKFDNTRKYWDNFYLTSKENLLPLDSLVYILNGE